MTWNGQKPYETLGVLDSQPFMASVDIYIGNHAFTKIPPNYLISFECERLSEGASKFQFVLLDRFWDEIEETLHLGFQNITFRYGHVTGRQSRMWIGLLTDYSLEFVSSGVKLTANGATSSIRQNLHKMTLQVEGTPDKVVKELCAKAGWQLGRIDECFEILDHSSLDSEEPRQKSWSILDANPARYIVEEVSPRAVRKLDGKGGYQFYIDDSTSPPTANFHPIDINPSADRTYVYHKGINTNVISFLPEFKGIFGGAGGGSATSIESNVVDPVSKEEQVVKFDINTNPDGVDTTGEFTHTPSDTSTVRVDATGMVHDEVSKVANYRWTQSFMQSYEASMEIVGDPTLEVTQTIRVIVMTDQGQLHHSSGIYMIKSIKDVVESGVMRTQLQLIRNGDLSAGVEIIKYSKPRK
jgi:hypothetical protein